MINKPYFWFIFTILFIGCVYFSIVFFPSAYPLVNLNLQMNRQAALKRAQELAQQNQWGPAGSRQTASFGVDKMVQYYVELEVGGANAFKKMLMEKHYEPYTWRVRHFKEGVTNETMIYFTPEGHFYGFHEKIPEEEVGDAYTSEFALKLAFDSVQNHFHIDLTSFKLIEKSQEIRPKGRIDHIFTFERTDLKIGDGLYRLRIQVSGNRITELRHYIKVPEAFIRRYTSMRSTNNTIASAAFISGIVLYILGGCIIGLYFLIREHWVIWEKPLLWAIGIASLQVCVHLNYWPLAWMNYDTALSAHGFLLQKIVELLILFIVETVYLSLTFMAAESLTRKAFSNHIQFWKIWSPEVASSTSVLGKTIGGTLLVGIFFAFDVALYFLANKLFGWWTPSEPLFEPDILATPIPWLTSIGISIHAGFWEECMFRAIPIAGAALLGKKFGHRNLWIITALIIQALIFSGAHANYPQQPAYARVVELFIPSIVFGLIYIKFGLLPSIILHYIIDVIWISMPLFISSAPLNWVNQIFVLFFLLFPILIILYARLRQGRWKHLQINHFNRSWNPINHNEIIPKPDLIKSRTTALNLKQRNILISVGILGLILWLIFTPFKAQVPFIKISRNEAIRKTHDAWLIKKPKSPESWTTLCDFRIPLDDDDYFLFEKGNQQDYHRLIGSYLPVPHYRVRFAHFHGDISERAEEYLFFINGDGHIFRMQHRLPENRSGNTITENQARKIVHKAINCQFKLKAETLQEISAIPTKHPNRRDWKFTFSDTLNYSLEKGEARIVVKLSGDHVTDMNRFVYLPESWLRDNLDKAIFKESVISLSVIITFLCFLIPGMPILFQLEKRIFSKSLFIKSFLFLFTIEIINLINRWPLVMARFSTSAPLSNQIFQTIGFSLLGALILSSGLSVAISFLQGWRIPTPLSKKGNILPTISAAIFISGIIPFINSLFLKTSYPLWPQLDILGKYSPLIGASLNPIIPFFLKTILYFFLFSALFHFTKGWTNKKWIFSISLLLLFISIQGAETESLKSWWIMGFIESILILLAFFFVLRFHAELIPLFFGTRVIFENLQQGVLNGYPAAIPGAIISSLIIGSIAFYWFMLLQKD